MNGFESAGLRARVVVCLSATVFATVMACKPKLKISAPDTLLPVSNAVGIAADQDNLYWFADGLVRKAPRSSLATSVVTLGSATFVESIVVDDQNVYWADVAQADNMGQAIANSGAIMKAPIAGGSPTTIASGLDLPSQLIVHDNAAFWIGNGVLQTASTSGGDVTTLATGKVMAGLTTDGLSLYWTDQVSDKAGTGMLEKTSFSGGGVTVIYNDLTAPGPMMWDGSELLWLDYGTYVPDPSGMFLQFDGQILHQKPSATTYTPFATEQQLPVAFAKANGILYWLNGSVDYMGKTYVGTLNLYGPRGVEPVTKDAGDCRYIAAVGTDVYWTNDKGIQHVTVH